MADKKSTIPVSAVSRNWEIHTRSRSFGLYRLALLIRGSQGEKKLLTGLADPDEPSEFIFDVNPQSLDVDEPAATQVVPTQDGGHFIESQGQLFKNITISGTTGLRPSPKAGQIIPILGLPNPFNNPQIGRNGLPAGEVSGFESMLLLTNLIRRYWDLKRNPEFAPFTELVWENGKTGEFYVVEPIAFKSRATSASPLTYQYVIQLKSIRRRQSSLVNVPNLDPIRNRTAFGKFFQRVAGYTTSLNNALRTVEGLIDRSVGIAQSTVNEVLRPARVVLDGLANITNAATNVLEIPKTAVANLALSANNLAQSIDSTSLQLNAYKTQGISTQLSSLKNAFIRIFRTSSAILNEDSLFKEDLNFKYNRRKNDYRNEFGPPRITGGDVSDIASVAIPANTRLVTIGGNDTIYSIAQKVLGSQNRWKELVLLNDLEPPYISASGDGRTVLRPQDTMLVPGFAGNRGSIVATEGDALLTKKLGRDLALVVVKSSGGIDLSDFAKSAKGDLKRVEGPANIQQAVGLKFRTKRGELRAHPWYGLALPIGSKASTRSLINFIVDAEEAVTSDGRISKLTNIVFDQEGNSVLTRAVVQITGVAENLNITLLTNT